MKFSIETVSKLTGLPAATLRNWEKRYGYPQPARSAGGHRLYAQKDVSFLKLALRLQNEGRQLQDLTKLYEGYVDDEPAPVTSSDDVTFRVRLVYESLLRYDIAATAQHWMIFGAKLAPQQMFSLVFEELLRRLGDDWSRGQISVAQEHFVSGFLRMKLGAFMTLDFPATQATSFALATLEGERHEGGLMLVGCHLKYRGYTVHYFGVDLPFTALNEALQESGAQIFGISYVDLEHLRRDLPNLARVEIPVVLGGIAVLALSDKEVREIESLYPGLFLCFEASSEKAADHLELVGRRSP